MMLTEAEHNQTTPLATAPIGKLMIKYAVPSVIALVVNALYNIVDQVFIGWGVGTLGNSATNVIFPLSMVVTAFSLLLGDGGAAFLSLELGRDNKKKAQKGVNNTISWLIITAIVFLVVFSIFLKPLTNVLGATPDNQAYALAYGRIVVIGFPFVVIGSGMCSLIRADGTPHLTMFSMIVGCVSNVILDAIFVLGFNWGMEGAALATIIGQILCFLICVWYIPRFQTVKITRKDMKPSFAFLKKISNMGISSFISQIAVAIVMAVINFYLVCYGSMSKYGADIPLAAFGIAMKFNTILVALATGIATGSQPIIGYNYGSGHLDRVKKSFAIAATTATIVASILFLVFQIFPGQLTALFGEQGALYTEFSILSFRIFPLFCFLNGFQIVVAIFFQSIGKPIRSGIISLSRQILFLIPAIAILCKCIGLTGVLWAGPVADGLAFLLSLVMIIYELRQMNGIETCEQADLAC